MLEPHLQRVYGDNASTQHLRYTNALERFADHFGSEGKLYIFRAPGRVNLIGEHTDYNHGFVLPAALDKDTLLIARPRHDPQIHLANIEHPFAPFSFSANAPVPKTTTGDWSNYMRGAAHVLAEHLGHALTGFDGLIVGAPDQGVPRGAGLSSSTAFTVVTMVALTHFNQPNLSHFTQVQLCSDAEWYVGTRGGIMDHVAAFFAKRNHALFLDCRPRPDGEFHLDRVPMPEEYRILVVDSGIKHQNTRGEFNQRVAACRAGVALLRRTIPGMTHLRDVQEVAWNELEPLLPESLTVAELAEQELDIGDVPGVRRDTHLRIRACCRHVWTENRRVLDAVEALHNDQIDQLGALMNTAHVSAREDYQISCPEIELLVEAAHQVEGVAGARLTGAGWGGCIVALVHKDAVHDFQRHVPTAYHQQIGVTPAIFPCNAGTAAGLVLEV